MYFWDVVGNLVVWSVPIVAGIGLIVFFVTIGE